MIDKKNHQKRKKFDGIRNISSSIIQARDDGMVFDTEEHDERRHGGPKRPSARGPSRKRTPPPGFKGKRSPGNRDSVFY